MCNTIINLSIQGTNLITLKRFQLENNLINKKSHISFIVLIRKLER